MDFLMIETRFFDSDPLTGTKTLYHFDHADQTFSFEEIHDAQPILDANRRLHNDATDKSWKGELHLVASLPLPVWFKLKKEGILDDKKAFKRWLNDPANAYFRTRPGRV
jgi:hypothetical protein